MSEDLLYLKEILILDWVSNSLTNLIGRVRVCIIIISYKNSQI